MDKQIRMGKFLILAFILPLAIYLKTLLPGVGFWDTGEFQTIPYTFDIGHPTGYPTYVVIGKIFLTIFHFNSVAWRMNFLSAIFVSLGIYIFSYLLFKLTKKLFLAITFGILLSVNPTLWTVAIKADPHALHFLFTSLFIFLGVKILKEKRVSLLPITAFICGLSLGNHMLSIFFIPSLLYLFISSKSIKGYKFFFLGASTYLLLPILQSLKPTLLNINYSLSTVDGFSRHVLGSDFRGLMNTWARENFLETLTFYFNLVKQSFPFYFWVLIPAGVFVSFHKHPKIATFLMLIFIPFLVFSMKYQNAAIERYFLGSFLIELIWIVIFIDKITKKFLVYFAFIVLIILAVIFNINRNIKNIDQSKNTHAYTWALETLKKQK
ncbi:MAG: DUF2723 domain-containing protein, partial [Patescibacteria group bacterium]